MLLSKRSILWKGVVVAGLLTSVVTLIYSRTLCQVCIQQTKKITAPLLHINFKKAKKSSLNKKLVYGGIVGSLLGMSSALLLAPKPGNEFISDIIEPFLESKRSIKAPTKQKIQQKATKNRVIPSRGNDHEKSKTKITKIGAGRAYSSTKRTARKKI